LENLSEESVLIQPVSKYSGVTVVVLKSAPTAKVKIDDQTGIITQNRRGFRFRNLSPGIHNLVIEQRGHVTLRTTINLMNYVRKGALIFAKLKKGQDMAPGEVDPYSIEGDNDIF